MLATGRVKLHNDTGIITYVRVLFDGGSEADLITEKCVNRADLTKMNFAVEIEGVTGTEIVDHGLVNVKISPWFESNENIYLYISCIIMKKLPMAQRTEFSSDTTTLQHLVKADPQFNKASGADIIIGIDTWSQIVMNQVLWSGTGLVAQLTSFGYVIYGAVDTTPKSTVTVASVKGFCMSENYTSRLDLLKRFWEDEEEVADDEPILSENEQRAVDHYFNSIKRADDGRLIARIPLIEGDTSLGESREIARQRFFQLERRLERNIEVQI